MVSRECLWRIATECLPPCLDGRQWELAPDVLDLRSQELVRDYVLFDVAQSAGTNSFTCAVQDQHSRVNRMDRMQRSLVRENANPDCVEIALDVDNYTFGTFGNNCNAAVDWAVGVLAGVDLIYRNELNGLITLQATYVNVWETPEPGPTSPTMQAPCLIPSGQPGSRTATSVRNKEILCIS